MYPRILPNWTLFFLLITIHPCLAQSEIDAEKLLYTLNNRDARLEHRKAAIETLSKNPTPEFRTSLIQILENSAESKVLQSYVANTISEMKDPELLGIFKKKLEERRANPFMRELALSILWRADPELGAQYVKKIAQDSYDQEGIRIAAMAYLTQIPNVPELEEVAIQIFNNRKNSDRFRQAALGLLESAGSPEMIEKLQRSIIADTTETLSIRRLVLAKAEQRNALDLTGDLMTIVSNPRDEVPMRIAALNVLASNNLLQPFIPQLEQLYRSAQNPSLRGEIKKVLDNAEPGAASNP